MSGSETEILKIILWGTSVIVVMAAIFIASLLFHQNRFIKSQREKLEILEKSQRDLQVSHDQLRNLAAHLEVIREEERINIAREIHDELGQLITVIKMDISLLRRKIQTKGEIYNVSEIVQDLQTVSLLADTTIQSIRRIATALRPEILDELGLIDAIEWETNTFQSRTGVKSDFITNLEEIELGQDRSTAVFRILQETLTNVARHANASEVCVTLDREANDLIIKVKDNGRGITEAELSQERSLGILGMRERALLLGGEVNIIGEHKKGTLVVVRIPINNS